MKKTAFIIKLIYTTTGIAAFFSGFVLLNIYNKPVPELEKDIYGYTAVIGLFVTYILMLVNDKYENQ